MSILAQRDEADAALKFADRLCAARHVLLQPNKILEIDEASQSIELGCKDNTESGDPVVALSMEFDRSTTYYNAVRQSGNREHLGCFTPH